MNKLYTLLTIMLLAGCSYPYNAFYSATNAFIQACTYASMETSLTNEGDKVILHATCTKAK